MLNFPFQNKTAQIMVTHNGHVLFLKPFYAAVQYPQPHIGFMILLQMLLIYVVTIIFLILLVNNAPFRPSPNACAKWRIRQSAARNTGASSIALRIVCTNRHLPSRPIHPEK